jgi:hypothetical protein
MAFPPGTQMDKVWQVQNSGSCAWGAGYDLVRAAGDDLGAAGAIPVPPTPAGQRADLAITFWAPAETGVYSSAWQLRSPAGAFFGPMLTLEVEVEARAQKRLPPAPPANLQAGLVEDGHDVHLTWEDRSSNEDAFRIYREEVGTSIGLAPADAESFVDEGAMCGHTYRYTVVAFNAAGGSPSDQAEVTLPGCGTAGLPPTLILTVVPTQVVASEAFTIVFQASDDWGLAQVRIWGEQTGDALLDAGRVFACTGSICTGTWPVTWTGPASATLTIAAVAIDSAGQQSEPARIAIPTLGRPP